MLLEHSAESSSSHCATIIISTITALVQYLAGPGEATSPFSLADTVNLHTHTKPHSSCFAHGSLTSCCAGRDQDTASGKPGVEGRTSTILPYSCRSCLPPGLPPPASTNPGICQHICSASGSHQSWGGSLEAPPPQPVAARRAPARPGTEACAGGQCPSCPFPEYPYTPGLVPAGRWCPGVKVAGHEEGWM